MAGETIRSSSGGAAFSMGAPMSNGKKVGPTGVGSNPRFLN